MTASEGSSTMTQENCAVMCRTFNMSMAGVEYAGQCFCGNGTIVVDSGYCC